MSKNVAIEILMSKPYRYLHSVLMYLDGPAAGTIRVATCNLWTLFVQFYEAVKNPVEYENQVRSLRERVGDAVGRLGLSTARYLIVPQHNAG